MLTVVIYRINYPDGAPLAECVVTLHNGISTGALWKVPESPQAENSPCYIGKTAGELDDCFHPDRGDWRRIAIVNI